MTANPPQRRPGPRGDLRFLILLVAVGLLAAILWIIDSSRRPDDSSRIGWPDTPAKSH